MRKFYHHDLLFNRCGYPKKLLGSSFNFFVPVKNFCQIKWFLFLGTFPQFHLWWWGGRIGGWKKSRGNVLTVGSQ